MLDAARVLHSAAPPRASPDDPALGEFRADFGGLLGTIEERQTDEGPGFAGADKIIGTDELFDRLEKDQDEHVDARAFLTGPTGGPVPGRLGPPPGSVALGPTRRRRQRAVDADPAGPRPGLRPVRRRCLLGLARLSAPQLVAFSPTYPSMVGLTWNARVLDRRLLSGLEWPVWDSVGDRAPGPAHRRGDRRRGGAPAARIPGSQRAPGSRPRSRAVATTCPRRRAASTGCSPPRPDVYASDKAERVEVDRHGDRTLDLAIYPAKEARSAAVSPDASAATRPRRCGCTCTAATTRCASRGRAGARRCSA